MTPPRLNFGQVSRGSQELVQTADLKRGDGGPIKLELRPLNSPSFKADLKEITPGEHYQLSVTLTPPDHEPRAYATLEIATGVSEAPTLTIPLFAALPPRVQAQPHHITVPSTREGDWEQVIDLVWDDGKPHKVLDATPSDAGLKTRIDEQDGKQRVVLVVPAGYESKHSVQRITIRTDDPATPTIIVPVSLRPSGPVSTNPPAGARFKPGASVGTNLKGGKVAPAKQPSTSDSH